MNKKSQHWPRTALAVAALVVLGFASGPGYAMSLGRIAVRSALGEPLRAEIDIPEINAEEAQSLTVSVANPEAFAAAGLEYNAALQSVQLSVQRRADGRTYILVTTSRQITDPFVDVIVEARWSSGRIIRDYTLLFDPPTLRPTPAPTLAQTTEPSAAARPSAPSPIQAPIAVAEGSRGASTVQPRPASSAAPVAVASKPPVAVQQPPAEEKRINVQNGDTASKIAERTRAGDVSLDQMLVALLRNNPDAFSKGNLNRLKAGAVLDIPAAEEAKKLSPAEASQIVIAQSKDFNEFRRNLAGNAPKAQVEESSRAASGKVEAKVEDKKAAPSPDKLTLSKESAKAKADEERIAKERADKEAAARASELAKNIADLSKISAAAKTPAASETKPLPAPTVAAPVAAVASAPASAPPVAAASAPVAPVSAPAKPSSEPASAPEKPKPAAPPPPEPEAPGLLDELLADPIVPAAAGGLVALLAGLAFWRQRKRKQEESQVESSFLASRLQPDSFFESSGLQHVDTSSGVPTDNASSEFSPSQMGSPDNVDPVAEADVYLAYGRDAQAEEILKEALRSTPERVAIHAKLASIYAKRRDAMQFQSSATQVFNLAGANSAEWAAVCALGLEIDPTNPMYQTGGTPLDAPKPAAMEPAFPDQNSTIAMDRAGDVPNAPVADVDLDLDLDFSADPEPEKTQPSAELPDISLAAPDLNLDVPAPAAPEPEPALPDVSLDLDIAATPDAAPSAENGLDFDLPLDPPAAPAAPPATAPADPGMLEFDLGSLSLDLDSPAPQASADTPAEAAPVELDLDMTDGVTPDGEDPLETKLALAEEFVSIGDSDGARALIEEVVAEASGPLRERAQAALSKLG